MREVRGVHLEIRITLPPQDRCTLPLEGGGTSVPIEGHLVGILIPATVNGSLHQWSLRCQQPVATEGGRDLQS